MTDLTFTHIANALATGPRLPFVDGRRNGGNALGLSQTHQLLRAARLSAQAEILNHGLDPLIIGNPMDAYLGATTDPLFTKIANAIDQAGIGAAFDADPIAPVTTDFQEEDWVRVIRARDGVPATYVGQTGTVQFQNDGETSIHVLMDNDETHWYIRPEDLEHA